VCVSSAGSRYWQSGSFEVSKSDTEAVDTQESVNGSQHSAVRVTVLTELEGVAYIQVTIRDSSNVDGGNGKNRMFFDVWNIFFFSSIVLSSGHLSAREKCCFSLVYFKKYLFSYEDIGS